MGYKLESKLSDILARKLTGDITDNEQVTLNAWLAESPEHRNLYERIIKGETIRAYEERQRLLDPDITINNINRKIRRRQTRRISAWAGSAAAVLLTGLFSFFFFTDKSIGIERDPEEYAPVISFNNGRKIKLDHTETGTEWENYLSSEKVSPVENVEDGLITVKIENPRGGSIFKLKLNDGSIVWLNSETVIEYPEKFRKGERKVRLTGEAYFDITEVSDTPFIISTVEDVSIEVLGTSFNVAAYPGEGNVTTTLMRGSVRISTPAHSVRLLPGHQAVVKHGTQDIIVSEVDASQASLWTTGVFDFDAFKLADICSRLSRWYDVDFVFSEGVGEERFSGRVWIDKTLDEFLSNITSVTDVTFTEKHGKIIVAPKK